jgi:hypothetical protein
MRCLAALFLVSLSANAVIVDRIAVIAGERAIKDSDIDREIRVVSFLNGEAANFDPESRKAAAQRLIDQTLVRRDIESARYSGADPAEVNKLFAQVRRRYKTDAQFQAALAQAGISADELRRAVTWQVTVLRFVEQRFRSAAVPPETDVRNYYNQHRSEFGKASFETARPNIERTLAGEKVNDEFYAWLEQQRRQVRIRYLEENLK